jgi:MPBQ/MSBQ methyltransferase
MDPQTFAARYDEVIAGPRMRALYGGSGYFNAGYWDAGVTELPAACDRLVDELAAAVPAGAELILDVGCGMGAGTRRLGERFPDALVIGANLSLRQLQEAAARGVEAPVVMDAARLALATGCADAVLAVESPQHFDTRADFLAEAHRVLRPGGVIALADMLFSDREPVGSWMLPPENDLGSPAEYVEALAGAGFDAVRVRDVTAVCWRPFCAVMRAVYRGHEAAVAAIEDSVSHYVLAFARKP